jgi:hypothetical protein
MMLDHTRGGVVAKVVVGSGDDESSGFGCGHDAFWIGLDCRLTCMVVLK